MQTFCSLEGAHVKNNLDNLFGEITIVAMDIKRAAGLEGLWYNRPVSVEKQWRLTQAVWLEVMRLYYRGHGFTIGWHPL